MHWPLAKHDITTEVAGDGELCSSRALQDYVQIPRQLQSVPLSCLKTTDRASTQERACPSGDHAYRETRAEAVTAEDFMGELVLRLVRTQQCQV